MKKFFFSTNSPNWAFSLATLVLRIGFGILTIPHGYGKLMGFSKMKGSFMSLLGIGSELSLSLAIFGEFFCSILLILGLFTRFAAFSLIITACVIVFMAHNSEIFGKGEAGAHYLLAYIAILLLGPGKYSLDAAIGGKSKR